MRRLKRFQRVLGFAGIALFICLASFTRAGAEDTKGKWQFGFGLSYFSTVDYIRSNSDLAIAAGLPDENGLPPVGSVDERPDINIMNQASIRDDFKLDFTASYGLTRWLALEAAVGYMNSPVGNIEYYNRDVTQEITGQNDTLIPACGPTAGAPSTCVEWTPQLPDEHKNNTFLPIGTMTEIPIHLSGLIRFRPESPLDPYIGLGFGYIMTDLKKGDAFNRTAATLADPNFRVTVADEGEFNLNNRCRRENGQSCTDFHPGPLDAKVNDTWEWHAIGGVDYYMSERFSVYVDARYVWTSGSVDIRTDGAHQVRFAVIDPGRLLLQQQGSTAPGGEYLWEDIGVPANAAFHALCPDCQNDGFLETEDKNMSGALDSSETEGWLYKLSPGSRIVDESLRIQCPACISTDSHGVNHANLLDTEDTNGNGYLDRYLVYGIDVCTTPQAVGNDRCCPPNEPHCGGRQLSTTANYIWPEGCPQRPEQLAPFAQLGESGCPPFPRNPDGTYAAIGNTNADNAADTIIIQGGHIRLGGFGLGVGFKFTF